MPPRKGARRGATARGGRNARCDRNAWVHDEVRQHGECLGGQVERREEEGEQKRTKVLESRPPTTTVSAPTGVYANQYRKRMRDSFQSTPSRSIFRAPNFPEVGGNSSRPPNACHKCGQPGHLRSQCTQPKALPPPPRVQTLGACFGCGGFGHVARFCPQRGGTRSESGSVQQPRQGQGFGRQQQRGSQSQPHFRKTTSVQGSRVERGASSSTPVQTTPGRVFTVSAATPPPPPPPHTTSQTPEASVVRGTRHGA